MKKNESSQSLIIPNRCKFSHMIWGTSNTVLSCHFQKENKLCITYPIIIEGNLRQKGFKFILRRPDLDLDIFYELVELIITDYYGLFKYHIYKTIPESFEYYHLIEVRYINEDECIFFTSFIYNNNIFLSEKEVQEQILIRKKFYSNIIISLRKFAILKISSADIVINCKIELIWKVIRNMKMIHKYSHLLGSDIDYEGDILKKDKKITVYEIKNKVRYKSFANITKCLISKSNLIKNCTIELLFLNEQNILKSSSLNKIIINIYEYNSKCSMYVLYFFNNIQKNQKEFSNFNRYKKKELEKFKNIIEYYNTNDSKLKK